MKPKDIQISQGPIRSLTSAEIAKLKDLYTSDGKPKSSLLGFDWAPWLIVCNWFMNRSKNPKPCRWKMDYHQDIREKKVYVEEWALKRAFWLNDVGEPYDLIAQTEDGRWMALERHDVKEVLGKVGVTAKLRVLRFPRTGQVALIEMEGEDLPLPKQPIASEKIWRYDTPYYQAFQASEFPENLSVQLR